MYFLGPVKWQNAEFGPFHFVLFIGPGKNENFERGSVFCCEQRNRCPILLNGIGYLALTKLQAHTVFDLLRRLAFSVSTNFAP